MTGSRPASSTTTNPAGSKKRALRGREITLAFLRGSLVLSLRRRSRSRRENVRASLLLSGGKPRHDWLLQVVACCYVHECRSVLLTSSRPLTILRPARSRVCGHPQESSWRGAPPTSRSTRQVRDGGRGGDFESGKKMVTTGEVTVLPVIKGRRGLRFSLRTDPVSIQPTRR